MCLIDTCLGVGEVAVSDHRSSVPSVNHLANIARYEQGITINLAFQVPSGVSACLHDHVAPHQFQHNIKRIIMCQ